MAQYKDGQALVTFYSDTIIGVETEWLSNVSPGDLFIADGEELIYKVLEVTSDTSIILDRFYKGDTKSTTYSITRDFTDVMKLPILFKGDKSTRQLLKYAVLEIEKSTSSSWNVEDEGDHILLHLSASLINADEYAAANAEINFTFYEDQFNTIVNTDLPLNLGM